VLSQAFMLTQALIIARKELVDGLRDVRAVVSSFFYAMMGPLVVGLVSLSGSGGSGTKVLAGMMSVFTLVAAFVGGMNVAMDTVAGERERHSLVPLLLNPVRRVDVVMGKWLAVCVFALAGFVINLIGFAVVFARAGMLPGPRILLVLAIGTFPLPLFAAAVQILISTVCRAVKEAQTYLSLVVFLPMGVGMLLVFVPAAAQGWSRFLPVAGQQLELEALMRGSNVPLLQAVVLGDVTAAMALFLVLVAARQLQREEMMYGN
jgi:sodium transport system permease protein